MKNETFHGTEYVNSQSEWVDFINQFRPKLKSKKLIWSNLVL
jgi:hypothetical protein